MNYRIIGTTLPVLELQLNPGEGVFAVSLDNFTRTAEL